MYALVWKRRKMFSHRYFFWFFHISFCCYHVHIKSMFNSPLFTVLFSPSFLSIFVLQFSFCSRLISKLLLLSPLFPRFCSSSELLLLSSEFCSDCFDSEFSFSFSLSSMCLNEIKWKDALSFHALG